MGFSLFTFLSNKNSMQTQHNRWTIEMLMLSKYLTHIWAVMEIIDNERENNTYYKKHN